MGIWITRGKEEDYATVVVGDSAVGQEKGRRLATFTIRFA